jgi:hypothetical protein
MLGSRPILPLALLWVAASFLAVVPGSGEAPAQNATAWKIEAERDKLTERVSRFALTLPKSDPVIQGKSVTAALTITCAGGARPGPRMRS